MPEVVREMVAFAHGSGSSRHRPQNRFVASTFNTVGLGTLLFDLLRPGGGIASHTRVRYPSARKSVGNGHRVARGAARSLVDAHTARTFGPVTMPVPMERCRYDITSGLRCHKNEAGARRGRHRSDRHAGAT